MDQRRLAHLLKLEEKLGIKFQDMRHFHNALIHSSYVNENRSEPEDNEKLELLGDSVLALIVNEYLYKELNYCSEGELSTIKSIVVSEHSLAVIARKLSIGHGLLLGKGEIISNGMNRQAILADTLEAILGAYYLDRGLSAVRQFIEPFIEEEVDKVKKDKHQKDYKTSLQLYTQQLYKVCPIYKTIKEEGPDHQKIFYVNVLINDKVIGSGFGPSKKLAQQDAAHIALKNMDNLS